MPPRARAGGPNAWRSPRLRLPAPCPRGAPAGRSRRRSRRPRGCPPSGGAAAPCAPGGPPRDRLRALRGPRGAGVRRRRAVAGSAGFALARLPRGRQPRRALRSHSPPPSGRPSRRQAACPRSDGPKEVLPNGRPAGPALSRERGCRGRGCPVHAGTGRALPGTGTQETKPTLIPRCQEPPHTLAH